MNLKISKIYPCGLSWSVEYEGYARLKIKNLEDVCPIHGKKCRNGSANNSKER